MVRKYRKKPVVIEAVLWTGDNYEPIAEFMGQNPAQDDGGESMFIETLEGTHRATLGDYIIKGVAGEFYPCKPEIFAATYEPA